MFPHIPEWPRTQKGIKFGKRNDLPKIFGNIVPMGTYFLRPEDLSGLLV